MLFALVDNRRGAEHPTDSFVADMGYNWVLGNMASSGGLCELSGSFRRVRQCMYVLQMLNEHVTVSLMPSS